MIKEVFTNGTTIEEAVQNGCKELGLSVSDVEYEVLQQPVKKTLGLFGGSPAKVRVFVEISPAKFAQKYIEDIVKGMGLDDITVTSEVEDNTITLTIEGDEASHLIGRRGETLDAVQYLTTLAANHVDGNYNRIIINIGDYREKREKTLENLGRSVAFRVKKSGKQVELEPMNPYERRIIHTAVQKVRGVISWSEGESIQRHIIIGPDPNYTKSDYNKNRRYGNNNRGGYNKNRNNRYNNKRNNTTDTQRKQINEGEGLGLYGRIDNKSYTDND